MRKRKGTGREDGREGDDANSHRRLHGMIGGGGDDNGEGRGSGMRHVEGMGMGRGRRRRRGRGKGWGWARHTSSVVLLVCSAVSLTLSPYLS